MNISKKIAVICDYRLLPDRIGGMDHFFWQFDKCCKENGFEINWFFPNPGTHGYYNQMQIFTDSDKSVEACFLSHLKIADIKYTHIFTHFTELCTSFYKEIKKHAQAKIFAVDHNPRPINGYPLKKRIQKRIKSIFYSTYTDVFIGVSHYTKRELLIDFGHRIAPKTQVIYNGVITAGLQKRMNRRIDKPVFLVVSHLRESKGIQDLIQSVADLPDHIKQGIRIDIYGDGPFSDRLKELVAQNLLSSQFSFKGNCDHLETVYSQYDYMLQPTHMECFSLSILESLAANVPVVTTNVGGNEEAVKDGQNGYIFKVKDTRKLTEILEKLYLGELSITENTSIHIENTFSLGRMVKQYMNLMT